MGINLERNYGSLCIVTKSGMSETIYALLNDQWASVYWHYSNQTLNIIAEQLLACFPDIW